jgi:hypothetical protein
MYAMKYKIKEIKLDARNFVNKITGQDKQIEEYEAITHQLTCASDNEKDQIKKQQIIKASKELTEETSTPTKDGVTIRDSTFDHYKPFQMETLAKKINAGYELMEKFNIPKEAVKSGLNVA